VEKEEGQHQWGIRDEMMGCKMYIIRERVSEERGVRRWQRME
jgi:hypothetical protein